VKKAHEAEDFSFQVVEGAPLSEEEADAVAELVARMIFENSRSQIKKPLSKKEDKME
jgi:hypothetical protein